MIIEGILSSYKLLVELEFAKNLDSLYEKIDLCNYMVVNRTQLFRSLAFLLC